MPKNSRSKVERFYYKQQIEPLKDLHACMRGDNSCNSSTDPNKAISNSIEGTTNHRKVAILGFIFFPYCPSLPSSSTSLGFGYLQDDKSIHG
jgi:hypothetical protein